MSRHLSAESVRYAVALEPAELAAGYVEGWVGAEDTRRLAFLAYVPHRRLPWWLRRYGCAERLRSVVERFRR